MPDLHSLESIKKREIYAFTRDGDQIGQDYARKLGAIWAGGSSDAPPEKLDAAQEFLKLAFEVGVKTDTTMYKFKDANQALDDLRHGKFKGAAVLVPG